MEKLSVWTFQFCFQWLGLPLTFSKWADESFQAQDRPWQGADCIYTHPCGGIDCDQ